MTYLLERTGSWFKRRFLGGTSESQLNRMRVVYERGLAMVTLGRGVSRLINGRDRVRISVHHRYVDEVYEPEVFERLKREVGRDDIFFDIGAYIGLYSIILSRQLGKKGRVYAFEPAPESQKLLKRHLRMNKVEGKVEVVGAAVGEKCGQGAMFTIGDHIQNSFSPAAFGDAAINKVTHVNVVSLDAFCEGGAVTPAWVKVDTEGWELKVLQGAVKTFSRNPSIRFVVEMHPYAWKSVGYDADTFRDFCAKHSLVLEPLTGQKDVFGEYGHVVVSVNAPAQR